LLKEAAIPAPVRRVIGNTSRDFKTNMLAKPMGIENGRDYVQIAFEIC